MRECEKCGKDRAAMYSSSISVTAEHQLPASGVAREMRGRDTATRTSTCLLGVSTSTRAKHRSCHSEEATHAAGAAGEDGRAWD